MYIQESRKESRLKFDGTIFKAYDIRGIFPDQLTPDIAYRIGNGLAGYLKPKQIAVGRDMRVSSDELFDSLATGTDPVRGRYIDNTDVFKVMHTAVTGRTTPSSAPAPVPATAAVATDE